MSVRVDLFASQPHYRRHLMPIFRALRPGRRGTIHELGDFHVGIGRIGLVAGGPDAQMLKNRCPAIYVEHGAGQSYGGSELAARQMPGYSAADGHRWPHILAFVSPNERTAANWTSAPALAVGSPKMDEYIRLGSSWGPLTKSVCFAWHWEATFVAEARSAWLHYASYLPRIVAHLKRQGYQVFGHSHPRWAGALDTTMTMAGMQILATDEDVFQHAGVLIVDNSSLGPEMSSLGRPVVWLNCPQYRRDVHHGGRFWEWPEMSVQIDDPRELYETDLDDIVAKIDDPKAIARHAYSKVDGNAAWRAARFIEYIVAKA